MQRTLLLFVRNRRPPQTTRSRWERPCSSRFAASTRSPCAANGPWLEVARYANVGARSAGVLMFCCVNGLCKGQGEQVFPCCPRPLGLSSKVRDRLRSSSSLLPYHCVAPFPKPLAPDVGVLGLRCFLGLLGWYLSFYLFYLLRGNCVAVSCVNTAPGVIVSQSVA